jgi:hypothetical protein
MPTDNQTANIDGGDSRKETGTRVALTFAVIWLACGIVAALGISALDSSNQRAYSELEQHGLVVQATVTATDPGNRNTVYYSFIAHGQTYESGDRAWPPNPEASQLKVGERIHVVYDSRNPNVSCACDPHQAAAPSAWWRRLIAGLFLGSIVAIVLTIRITKGRDWRPTRGVGLTRSGLTKVKP